MLFGGSMMFVVWSRLTNRAGLRLGLTSEITSMTTSLRHWSGASPRRLCGLFSAAVWTVSAAMTFGADEIVYPDLSETLTETRSKVYVAQQPVPSPTPVQMDASPQTGQEDAAAKKKAAAAKKKKAEDLKKAVGTAYAPLFFNNKFAYVNDPAYSDWHLGEDLKRIKPTDGFVFDLGGQFRMRHHSERNHRGLGLTGVDDDFLLYRTRLFGNAEFADGLVRAYAEMIDAESNYEQFAPRGIEVNRTDLLNGFVDLRLLDLESGKLVARGGRQELLYGSQRLVSPLDWANTRRTFEGYSLLWQGKNFNIDGFYTRPVTISPHTFDSPDYQQEFMGVYSSYKGIENQTIDAFYLRYNNHRAPQNFENDTFGGRWTGAIEENLWDLEGGVQLGENNDQSAHTAGYWTAGLGRKMKGDWKPTLWIYYDWASGGDQVGARQGFDHLFPLAHKYLGFMDLFGRSNIESPNALLTLQPREKLQLLFWYHYLFLEDRRDSPYNVNMSAFNGANTPGSNELGHEIDILTTYTITPRSDLVFGYSHFFSGEYYRTTPGIAYSGDADFFYTQYQVNF